MKRIVSIIIAISITTHLFGTVFFSDRYFIESESIYEPYFSQHISYRQESTAVGAIRWDYWGTDPKQEVYAENLSPEEYWHRLPWYAQVNHETKEVVIPDYTQEIVDSEIKYAKRAGIDYWAFIMYDAPSNLALNLYLTSEYKNDVKWAAMLGVSWFTIDIEWLFEQFKKPNYQKVADGRPLVYAEGGWVNIVRDYAIQEYEALEMGSEEREKYKMPFIVSTLLTETVEDAKNRQVDAVSRYVQAIGGEGTAYSSIMSNSITVWNNLKDSGMHVIPNITTGWDPRPRMHMGGGTNWSHPATPAQIVQHLDQALEWVYSNRTSTLPNAVLMYAWNELDEGGWLMPTYNPDNPEVPNTERIDALEEFFRKRNNVKLEEYSDAEKNCWEFVLRDDSTVYIYEDGSKPIATKTYNIINKATGKAMAWQGTGWDGKYVVSEVYDEKSEFQKWQVSDVFFEGDPGHIAPFEKSSGIQAIGSELRTQGFTQPVFLYEQNSGTIHFIPQNKIVSDSSRLRGIFTNSVEEQSLQQNQTWVFEREGNMPGVVEGETTDAVYRIRNKMTNRYLSWDTGSLTTMPYDPDCHNSLFRVRYESSLSGYRISDASDSSNINRMLYYNPLQQVVKLEWNPHNIGGDNSNWTACAVMPGRGDFLSKGEYIETQITVGGKYLQDGPNIPPLLQNRTNALQASNKTNQVWEIEFEGIQYGSNEVIRLRNKFSGLYLTRLYDGQTVLSDRQGINNQLFYMFYNEDLSSHLIRAYDSQEIYLTLGPSGNANFSSPDWENGSGEYSLLSYDWPIEDGTQTTISVLDKNIFLGMPMWYEDIAIEYSDIPATENGSRWILEKTGEDSSGRGFFRLKNKFSGTYMTWTGTKMSLSAKDDSKEQIFRIYYNTGYHGYFITDKTHINLTFRFDLEEQRLVKGWNYDHPDEFLYLFNAGSGDYMSLEDGEEITIRFGDRYARVSQAVNPHTPKINLIKSGDDFILNIYGWQMDNKYQIWIYKQIESDIFQGEELKTPQWILVKPYTAGNDRTDTGFYENPDGSIGINLGPCFESTSKSYKVALKIADSENEFIAQIKDVYTPEGLGEIVINKIEVDGVFTDERTVVKNIDDETVGIQVFTNITDGVTYEAMVNPGNIALTPDGNAFDWDISALEPGRYTVTLKAQNGGTSDERVVRFNLYKVDETIVYGQMDTMTVTGEVNEGVFAIDISPDIPSGNWVNYTISEPWRAAIHRSPSVDKGTAQEGMTDINISEGEYGIYQIATYVRRNETGSADDGMIRRVEYARDGAKSLDIEVDGDGYTSGTLTKTEGVQITITPDAELDLSQGEQMEYSYWRRDARGWVMIRDYSTTPGLTWTPARVGLYTIQVRAKGSDAGSYELIQNIEFNVTGADPLLTVDEITLSGTDNVDARVPVTITAGVVNPSSEDLLYKYIISNDYIYYVETAYSADPTYIWTPGKAGEYRVSVLVKNQASFGKYDVVKTFYINVG